MKRLYSGKSISGIRAKRLIQIHVSAVQKNRSGGFTLVEVLISLVLLTLIMSLLFGALHLATKSWQTGERHNNTIEEKRLISEYLRRQFNQAVPLIWTDPRGGKLIFEGEEDRIRFVSTLPINRNIGKLSLLELFVEEVHNGTALHLAYQDLSPDRSPFEERDEETAQTLVLNEIEEITFQYFGRQKAGTRPPEWFEKWESKNLMPMLIKFKITMHNSDQWPDIIIPIMVDNTRGLRQFILQASLAKSRARQADKPANDTEDEEEMP